jgi:uncharacterized surface protein with fasciclin (FAS1) repeats
MKKAFWLSLLMISFSAIALGQDRTSALRDLSARLGDDGQHGILIGLLRTADVQDKSLAALLRGSAHTVLAPTDAAFAKLPKGAVAALKKDKSKLHEFLFTHILVGKVMIADMLVPVEGNGSKTLIELKNLAGAKVAILCNEHTGEHHPRVNGVARIAEGDILFLGGVIHNLDAVLASHSSGVN